MNARGGDGPRVVQVITRSDPQEREPEAQLRAWPTFTGVAAAAARAGVSVTVMLPSARDHTIDRDGVRYLFVREPSGTAPRTSSARLSAHRAPTRLLRQLASIDTDVVHLHGFVHPVAAHRLRATLPRVPLLVQDHASTAPTGARRLLWRWAFGRANGVAFAAREQAAPFVERGVLPPSVSVFEVVEGSTHFVPGDREEARRATGLCGDPCILWTGRLDANKDPLTALDAFERVAAELPGARLWCRYGDAPMLVEVQRRIAASPALRQRVTLLGRCPPGEMERHYRAADLFVQPSHREGCSYSTIEALACGVTPVVSDIPSMRRIVGEAGALVPVADAPALAAAIVEQARRDPAARRAAARARFESALSYDQIGRDLRRVYDALRART
jgi:glycosyltransferase involved in cell wall biosynthesis